MTSFAMDLDGPESASIHDIHPIAKERLHRQIDDFSMGVSLAFSPDPSMDWSPRWVNEIQAKKGKKAKLVRAGAKEVPQDDLPSHLRDLGAFHHGVQPHSQTSKLVMQRMGHGSVWPWPPNASKPDQEHKNDEFSQLGILEREEYRRRMEEIGEIVKKAYTSLRTTVALQASRIHETVVFLAEDDRGRGFDPTMLETSPGKVSDAISLAGILASAWSAAVQSVNDELGLDGTGMEMDHVNMPVSRNPDLGHFKEHMVGTGIYRQHTGAVPWVDFDPSYSNVGVDESDATQKAALDESRRRYTDWERKVRAAFLVPHLNVAELSRPENILSLIHTRGCFQPNDYAKLDHEASHIGRMSRILRGFFSGFTGVRFQSLDDNEQYLKLDTVFPNLDFVKAADDKFSNAPNFQEETETDKDTSDAYADGKLFGTGEAHIILLSQAVTYRFLDGFCRRAMEHAREYYYDPEFDYDQPTELSPSELARAEANLASADTKLNELIRACRDNSHDTAEISTQYWPTLNQDFEHYIAEFIGEEWAAAYRFKIAITNNEVFLVQFQQELAHHYGHLEYKNSNTQVFEGINDLSTIPRKRRYDLYYDIIGNIFRGHLVRNLMWGDLVRLLEEAVDELRQSVDTDEPIELDTTPVLPQTMRESMAHLVVVCREYYTFLLSELVNRGKFVADEKLRHLFSCVMDRQDLFDKGGKKLRKTLREFPPLMVEMDVDSSEPEAIQELTKVMFLILGNPVAVSITSMKKLVDDLRLMNWDPEVQEYISPLVRDIIDTMGRLVDLATHLDSLKLVRRALEVDGLFFGVENDCTKFRQSRRKYHMYTGYRSLDMSPIHAMERCLDTFNYEDWDEVPKYCYRYLYAWLDQRMFCSEPGVTLKTDDKAEEFLMQLTNRMFDRFQTVEAPGSARPLTPAQDALRKALSLPERPPPKHLGRFRVLSDEAIKRLKRNCGSRSECIELSAADLEDNNSSASTDDEDDPAGSKGAPGVTDAAEGEEGQEKDGKVEDADATQNSDAPATDDTQTDAHPASVTANDTNVGDTTAAEAAAKAASKRSPVHKNYVDKAAKRYQRLIFHNEGGTPVLPANERVRTPSSSREDKKLAREEKTARTKRKTTREARKAQITTNRAKATRGSQSGSDDGGDSRVVLTRSAWDNLLNIYSHLKPTPTAVTWDDFEAGFIQLGYTPRHGTGSSKKFHWTEDCAWLKKQDGMRKLGVISYHRFHESKDVPTGLMRDYVKMLVENHGLSWEFIQRFYKRKGD